LPNSTTITNPLLLLVVVVLRSLKQSQQSNDDAVAFCNLGKEYLHTQITKLLIFNTPVVTDCS